MRQTEFKVLMHINVYVDPNRLHMGIYESSIPTLYSNDTTIQDMIDRAMNVAKFTGNTLINQDYFDNLKQCQLVPVRVTVVENEQKDENKDKL